MTGNLMTGHDGGSYGGERSGGMAHSASLRCHLAAQVFADIPELTEDMEARPKQGEAGLAFAQRLLVSPTPEEAITFMAQLFARRVSIWWGHECLRYLHRLLDPLDQEMMGMCANWVAAPDEANRLQIAQRVENCATRSPGVWLAMAASWSGGSMSPPDTPVVPPPRFLTGRGVNAAVLSALARGKRADRQETLETFIAMAHDLV